MRLQTPRLATAAVKKFGDVQARADAAFRAHNMKAEPPMAGETLSAYRRRVIKPLQFSRRGKMSRRAHWPMMCSASARLR